MNKILVKFLAELATDSRMLAAYQKDPDGTMASFGLHESDIKELIVAIGVTTTPSNPGNGPTTGPIPVTH